ncbi:MAG: PDZ domain-containing protein [Jatrophihabitans sp.]|uniref:YlbL family protein n=1 Tax=Jatrophihabitans sp. TaxID=1932789 RepID=UPI0039105DA8
MSRLALPSIECVPGGRAFASLSRRVRTLAVAGILFVVLFVLALTMPVPYVVLSPGPTYNTLGTDDNGNTIVVIDGRKPSHTSGHLNLTTVSISSTSLTPFQAIAAWLNSDEVVVPKASIYPPGTSEQKTNEQNTQDFLSSQDSATAAALCELHYPKGFGVLKVNADGPSHGVLQPGDFLRTVDGKPAGSVDALSTALATESPGKTVPLTITRDAKPAELDVKLGPPLKKKKNGARLGIVVANGCLAPFTIDLGLGNQIGGPSAGLMFALGIMDKVGTVDLTKGRFIAGTGTIDSAGKVGAIGGIQLKMIAAKNKGASVFLAPAGNCGDVRKATPHGLKVIKVSTLHSAVQSLLDLQEGKPVVGC